MTFVAQIKADGSGFSSTVDELATKLTGLEQKSKTVGETATTAFTGAGGATEGLNDKLSGAAGAFDKLAQAIGRERAMLEQINGPAQRYEQNLQTLDSLLNKNMISTEQYAEQVRNLNSQLERQQTIQETNGGGGLGGGTPSGGIGLHQLGGGITAFTAAAAAAAATMTGLVTVVNNEIEYLRKLSDQYTNLRNDQLRFTDAAHGTEAVMAQQDQVATALHATMKDTSDVYYGVRNALNDYGMSASQVARITQTVGEAAMMAGKPMESAGEIVNRMVVAMNSGADSARSLRMIMVEYPALAHVWENAFHTDIKGVMALAKAHKIGAQDLAAAWANSTTQIDADYQKRGVTYQQELARMDELVAVYHKYGASISEAYALSGNGNTVEQNLIAIMYEHGHAQEALNLQMQIGIAYAKDLYDKFENLAHAKEEAFGKKIGQQVADFNSALLVSLKLARDNAKAIAESPYGKVDDAIKHLRDSEKMHSDEVLELDQRLKAHNITLAEYDKLIGQIEPKAAKLSDTERAEKQILDQLHGAADRYNLDVEALGLLLDKNKISVDEYITKLHELSDAYNKAATAQAMSALSARGGITGELGITPSAPGAGPASLPYETAGGAAFPTYQDPTKLIEQHKKELAQLEAQAKKSAEALQKVFDPIVNGIEQVMKTGQLNISKIGQQIFDDITQMLLKMGEMKLIGVITGAPMGGGGGGGVVGGLASLLGGLPGFASGGSGVVGGTGGTDSQVFMARATPGEHYAFWHPGQVAAQQQAPSGPTQVVIHDSPNPRAITAAYATPEFERNVLRIVRKHRQN